MIVPKVYCFFNNFSYDTACKNDLIGEYSMIAHWMFSWKQYGWEPIVLMPIDMPDTESSQKTMGAVKRLPMGVQNAQYFYATMLRWYVWLHHFDEAGHAFFGDYDIINYGLSPDHKELMPYLERDITSFHDGWGFVMANRDGLQAMVHGMTDGYNPETMSWDNNGTITTSDSHIGWAVAGRGRTEGIVADKTRHRSHAVIEPLIGFPRNPRDRDLTLMRVMKLDKDEGLKIDNFTFGDLK
jgi:hypothetical protein